MMIPCSPGERLRSKLEVLAGAPQMENRSSDRQMDKQSWWLLENTVDSDAER